MNFKKRVSALHKIALVVLAAAWSDGFAVGLGSLQVQSALNQPLRATLPIFGTDISSISELCPKGKIESFDGVLLARPQISFSGGAQPPTLIITTTQPINEPAVAINIEVGCGTSVRRGYQALLDPVATPQVAAKGQPSAPALADVSMNPVQAAFAAAPAVPAAAASTKQEKATRGKEEKVRASSLTNLSKKKKVRIASVEQPTSVDHKRGLTTQLHSKKTSHNVLRLSAEVNPVESTSMLNGLKLSDSIMIQGLETDPQKVNELRAAQLRFAAVMRGEDPEQNAENETRAAQEKIQTLLKEADQIKQQTEQARIAFEEEQKKSVNVNWFMGLGALLLVCVIAIAWLARRLAEINRINQRPFWSHDDADEDDTATSSHDHDDSPFSDTVVEFEDTSSLHDDAMTAVSAESGHSENDATFGKPAGKIHSVSKDPVVDASAGDIAAAHPVETSAEILPLPKQPVSLRNRKRLAMIEVEEISDAMEEAEFWISLRDPQRAISVLEHFGDVARPKSPMAWLYLLKLYREINERAKFDALLQRFKAHFNTKAPEWDAKLDETSAKGLEDYPHLVNQICLLWGSNQVARYLEDLLFNNRDGQREGFDLPVYLDLIMLANIAYEVLPSNRNGKPANVSHI